MTITLEVLAGPDYTVDDDGWENHTYTVRLRNGGRYMDTEWHQGLGITDDPTAETVLKNLISLADAIEYDSFEEWAADYGYDTDSRKAEQMYRAVRREAKRVRTLIGTDAWDRIVARADDSEAAAKALAA